MIVDSLVSSNRKRTEVCRGYSTSAFCLAVLVLVTVLVATVWSSTDLEEMNLSVDASEVTRRILHCRLLVPAKPGSMKLVYPKWVPGDHRPDGPIMDLVGLRFKARGKVLQWVRDSTDMYAFQIQVPDDADKIQVTYDLVGPVDGEIWHLGRSTTSQLTVLNWNQVVLYPEGQNSDNLIVRASIHLPLGWKFGTALAIDRDQKDFVAFRPVTLTTLVDSPLIAGSHFREIEVTPNDESRRHFLEISGDSEAALAIPEEEFAHFRGLVAETGALFGARHYESYHFLISLYGNAADGNEHHESSDNRLPEMGLADPDWRLLHGSLFAHEMTHSWNGKYRRPAGLATSDYQQPMKGDLLWVYEGLTSYLGRVLATRSGFLTPQQTRDAIAEESAALSWPGRSWRSLSDTAVSAQFLYNAPPQWDSWRRGTDFYEEGVLVWLEIDTIIRQQSQGVKSLDDFCRLFAGGQSGPAQVVTYTFDDIVKDLNAVVPYDWAELLTARLTSVDSRPPFGGIERSGWMVTYDEHITEFARAEESLTKQLDARHSIGLLLAEDGEIIDTIEGGPAAHAGAAPGMKVVAVNGRKYTPDVLRQELKLGKTNALPLELHVTDGQYSISLHVDYHGGERYPRLERDRSGPDLLSSILAPRTSLSHQ